MSDKATPENKSPNRLKIAILGIFVIATGYSLQYYSFIRLELTLSMGDEAQKKELLRTIDPHAPLVCQRILREIAQLTDRRLAHPSGKILNTESLLLDALNSKRKQKTPVRYNEHNPAHYKYLFEFYRAGPRIQVKQALDFWEFGAASHRAKTKTLARLSFTWKTGKTEETLDKPQRLERLTSGLKRVLRIALSHQLKVEQTQSIQPHIVQIDHYTNIAVIAYHLSSTEQSTLSDRDFIDLIQKLPLPTVSAENALALTAVLSGILRSRRRLIWFSIFDRTLCKVKAPKIIPSPSLDITAETKKRLSTLVISDPKCLAIDPEIVFSHSSIDAITQHYAYLETADPERILYKMLFLPRYYSSFGYPEFLISDSVSQDLKEQLRKQQKQLESTCIALSQKLANHETRYCHVNEPFKIHGLSHIKKVRPIRSLRHRLSLLLRTLKIIDANNDSSKLKLKCRHCRDILVNNKRDPAFTSWRDN